MHLAWRVYKVALNSRRCYPPAPAHSNVMVEAARTPLEFKLANKYEENAEIGKTTAAASERKADFIPPFRLVTSRVSRRI